MTAITVTQEDIDNGSTIIPSECPIALAVARATGRKVSFVGPITGVVFDTSPKTHLLPESAADFIVLFDLGREVCPFSFELEV
jgi:hypothetical protein